MGMKGIYLNNLLFKTLSVIKNNDKLDFEFNLFFIVAIHIRCY